ncbi:MAG TPA: hypothetical protein VFA03_14575 [Acetobacteraceae bacterium]|nr:hypothetical protein [Acetobacteraceae bacterium]
MGQILVRGIDEDTKARLRRLASERGSSLEAFVRNILYEAAAAEPEKPKGLGTEIAGLFKDAGLTAEEAASLELRGEWGMRIPNLEE